MLRRNATPWWLVISLLCLSALASAQSPAPVGDAAESAADAPNMAGLGNVPALPVAEPSRSPANILDDGPRDVGTKIDPTVCNSRPLPDDLLAQCRRWLLIASASEHSATPKRNAHTASYRQVART